MKSAKVGQLTAMDNRSRLIDRPDCLTAEVLAVPTAQPAWLAGRGSDVGCAGVAVHCRTDEELPALKKCDADIVDDGDSVRAAPPGPEAVLTNFPRDFAAQCGERSRSFEYHRTTDSRSPCLPSVLSLEGSSNAGRSTRVKDRYKVNDVSGSRFPFAETGGTKCRDAAREITAHPGIAGNDLEPPFMNVNCAPDQECDSALGQMTRVSSKTEKDTEIPVLCDDGEDNPVTKTQVKYHKPPPAQNPSYSRSNKNINEFDRAIEYANFAIENKSPSFLEDHKKPVCLRSMEKTERIYPVNNVNCHPKRLSHSYLNKIVTDNDQKQLFLETGPNFPRLIPDSKMFFTAAAADESCFPDKISGNSRQSPTPSPDHHYYNKTAVFKTFVSESSILPSNSYNRQIDEKVLSGLLNTKGGCHQESKMDHDLDLVLFPQLSQTPCPGQGSSPLTSPQLYHHHHYQQHGAHQDHERQQLLNHFQPHSRRHHHHHHHHHLFNQQHRRHYSTTSASSLIHHVGCCSHHIRISPVSLLWTFLSVLVAGTCLLTFLTPYWIVHPDRVHSFGLFNLCVRDQRFSHPRPLCVNFGYQHYYTSSSFRFASASANASTDNVVIDTTSVDIARIPSGAWQAACLLFGMGVCVQLLGALVSLVVLALKEPWHHRTALLNGYMQTVGVLLLMSGLLLYPVGFSSPFYSYYCESFRAFCTGHCSMGWSYVTAVMVTALSIFCPVMSSFAEAQQTARKPSAAVGALAA